MRKHKKKMKPEEQGKENQSEQKKNKPASEVTKSEQKKLSSFFLISSFEALFLTPNLFLVPFFLNRIKSFCECGKDSEGILFFGSKGEREQNVGDDKRIGSLLFFEIYFLPISLLTKSALKKRVQTLM